jgi:ABC-type nitrate/sulfonate/bicarbonate transport system permease component
VYAGVVVTGLLGFLINWVTVVGERRLFGWQPALREAR